MIEQPEVWNFAESGSRILANPGERMIKPIVLTRKNSLFAGHDEVERLIVSIDVNDDLRQHGT
jgi:hypothetical protein